MKKSYTLTKCKWALETSKNIGKTRTNSLLPFASVSSLLVNTNNERARTSSFLKNIYYV